MNRPQSLRTVEHPTFVTKDETGAPNGFLVPIFNIHDGVFPGDEGVQQVYLTTVLPGSRKGPHLHKIRRGWFTCIKGNVRVTVKVNGKYEIYWSGEDNSYRSIEIPTGVPALLENDGTETAFVLNMPSPAWTPEMRDEYTADFSDRDS